MNDSNSDSGFEPNCLRFITDPTTCYQCLRNVESIPYNTKLQMWLVSRYSDVKHVLSHSDFATPTGLTIPRSTRQSGMARPIEQGLEIQQRWMLSLDAQEHAVMRAASAPAFSRDLYIPLQERCFKATEAAIFDMKQQKHVDLICDLAQPVALSALLWVMGMPAVKATEAIPGLVDKILQSTDLQVDAARFNAGLFAITALMQILKPAFLQSGEQPYGLISVLWKRANTGEISEKDALSSIVLALSAGLHSTINLLGFALFHFMKKPSFFSNTLQDERDIEAFIDEVLRYETPIQGMRRIAVKSTVVSGQRIEKGEKLFCLMAAANRDPDVFDQPDQFSLVRRTTGHLSFGKGAHSCIGKHMAKVIAATVIKAALKNGLRVSLSEEPKFRACFLSRGIKSLPAKLVM